MLTRSRTQIYSTVQITNSCAFQDSSRFLYKFFWVLQSVTKLFLGNSLEKNTFFYPKVYDQSPPIKKFLIVYIHICFCSFFSLLVCTLSKMNRVHHPHLLTSFSLFSRVVGKEKIWAPVAEFFLFPQSTEFGLKVLIELGVLLRRGGREGRRLHKNHACSLKSLYCG